MYFLDNQFIKLSSCSHHGLVDSVLAQLGSLEICSQLQNIVMDEVPSLLSIGFVILLFGIFDNARQIIICKLAHPMSQSFKTHWHKAGHVIVHDVFGHLGVILKSEIHAGH